MRVLRNVPVFALLVAVMAAAQNRPVDTFRTKSGPVKLTVIRHASLMLEAGGRWSTSIRGARGTTTACRRPI